MPGKMKRDYSDIAPQVVEYYKQEQSVRLTAEKFRISSVTVSRLCKAAGLTLTRRGNPRGGYGRPTEVRKPDTCSTCRSYSRTDIVCGWCMTHRRMTRGVNVEPCYK